MNVSILTQRLTLNEISAITGIHCSSTSHERGSTRGARDHWAQTIWRLEANVGELVPLGEHIDALRASLGKVDRQSREQLREGCRWILDIAVFFDTAACTVELPASAMTLLTDWDLELSLSSYPSAFEHAEGRPVPGTQRSH